MVEVDPTEGPDIGHVRSLKQTPDEYSRDMVALSVSDVGKSTWIAVKGALDSGASVSIASFQGWCDLI